MDQVMQFVEPSRQFVKDSIRLVKRCTKPDRKGRFILFLLAQSLLCWQQRLTSISTKQPNFKPELLG